MKSRPLAVDFCTGAGGMASGMLAAGFEVVGVDLVVRQDNPARVVVADVREMDPHAVPVGVWDHYSPPCNRFSSARASRVDDPPTEEDLDILEACLRLRDARKPRFWSVENVRGAVKWFRPLLGEPRLRHGPFFFWGNFPAFLAERQGLIKGLRGSSRTSNSHRTRDPWLRAKLPIELTRPMARAIAQEVTLSVQLRERIRMNRDSIKSVHVGSSVSGGVEIPFSAVCSVNRKPFAGKVTVSWEDTARVPEYDSLAVFVGALTTMDTTCEGLAVDIRKALGTFPDITVRVDVTNEAHLRAWAVRAS